MCTVCRAVLRESEPTITTSGSFRSPDRVIILTERNMQYRQIFTDGRPLPRDPNPTWNGYSTARWEGDTLVVHTTGFKDDLWLDAFGNPLTSAARLTEKVRRPNYGTLEVEMTIDDPKSYTAPWTVTLSSHWCWTASFWTTTASRTRSHGCT